MTTPAPLHKMSSNKLLSIKQQALGKQHRHLLLRPRETTMPLKLSLPIWRNAVQVRAGWETLWPDAASAIL